MGETGVTGPNWQETYVLELDSGGRSSNSLAAGQEQVTGPKVPSDLLQLD